jgi:hypothetical protein
VPRTTKNKVVNERVLKSPVYGFSSRFVVGGESSLVRIPIDSAANRDNERVLKERKEEWAERDLNSRSPPCQGGILTRLDHRPNI